MRSAKVLPSMISPTAIRVTCLLAGGSAVEVAVLVFSLVIVRYTFCVGVAGGSVFISRISVCVLS